MRTSVTQKGVARVVDAGARFDPDIARQYPQTVARTSAIRLRAKLLREIAPGQQQDLPPTVVVKTLPRTDDRVIWTETQRGERRGQGQADFPAE